LWIKHRIESKRDLEFNQAPIATKPEVQENYGISTGLLAVTKCKEESPYKPQTTLISVRPRLKNAIALIIALKLIRVIR
jgi:hypothetical protein